MNPMSVSVEVNSTKFLVYGNVDDQKFFMDAPYNTDKELENWVYCISDGDDEVKGIITVAKNDTLEDCASRVVINAQLGNADENRVTFTFTARISLTAKEEECSTLRAVAWPEGTDKISTYYQLGTDSMYGKMTLLNDNSVTYSLSQVETSDDNYTITISEESGVYKTDSVDEDTTVEYKE